MKKGERKDIGEEEENMMLREERIKEGGKIKEER